MRGLMSTYIPPLGWIFIDNLNIASLLTISCAHLASGGSPRALPGGQRSTLHRMWRYHAVCVAPLPLVAPTVAIQGVAMSTRMRYRGQNGAAGRAVALHRR